MRTTLEQFNTNLRTLKNDLKADKELSQNHFGDFLMIEEDVSKDEKYRVWLNHPENVKQGESVWIIEYFGNKNGYVWRTIAQGND